MVIMGSAQESDPFHRRLAPECHRIDVIELQQGARRATLTGRAGERAMTTVSLPHRAYWSLSCVLRPTVSCKRKRSGATGVTFDRGAGPTRSGGKLLG